MSVAPNIPVITPSVDSLTRDTQRGSTDRSAKLLHLSFSSKRWRKPAGKRYPRDSRQTLIKRSARAGASDSLARLISIEPDIGLLHLLLPDHSIVLLLFSFIAGKGLAQKILYLPVDTAHLLLRPGLQVVIDLLIDTQ